MTNPITARPGPMTPSVTVRHRFGQEGNDYTVAINPTFRKPVPLIAVQRRESREAAAATHERQLARAGKAKALMMIGAVLDREHSYTLRGQTPEQLLDRRIALLNKFLKRGHIGTIGLSAGPLELNATRAAARDLAGPASTLLHGSREEVRQKLLSLMQDDEFAVAVAAAHPEAAERALEKTVGKFMWSSEKDIAATLRPRSNGGRRHVGREDVRQLGENNIAVRNTDYRNAAKQLSRAMLNEARHRVEVAKVYEQDWAMRESKQNRLDDIDPADAASQAWLKRATPTTLE